MTSTSQGKVMKGALWIPACLLVCRGALAQGGLELLSYSAPEGCPSEQQFRDQVSTRLLRNSPQLPSAGVSNALPKVTVAVRLEPAERRAFLSLREGAALPLERTVHGDTCAELVEGVALIAALAFGAESPDAQPSEPLISQVNDPHATPEPPPQAATEPLPASPESLPSRLLHEVRAPAQSAGPERAQRTDVQAASTALSFELGAGAFLNSWVAPDGGRGADGFLRIAPRLGGWSARMVGFYGQGAGDVSGRRAEFKLWGARLEGCPISRTLSLNLLGEACLAFEAGSLHGRGDPRSLLLEGESRRVFWAAASLTARLRAALGRWISLEAEGDLALPMVRHEFLFDEDVQVFETPWVGYGARLGAALHFL